MTETKTLGFRVKENLIFLLIAKVRLLHTLKLQKYKIHTNKKTKNGNKTL